MRLDLGEIGAAPPEARVTADLPPAFSRVIRTIDAALLRIGFYSRIKNVRIAARNVEPDAPEALLEGWQSICQLLPGIAAVCRFEEAALRPLPRAVLPRPLPPSPQVGVNDPRIRGIERDLNRAGVFVPVQYGLPSRATIQRSIDSALFVRAVRMAERGDEDPVR